MDKWRYLNIQFYSYSRYIHFSKKKKKKDSVKDIVKFQKFYYYLFFSYFIFLTDHFTNFKNQKLRFASNTGNVWGGTVRLLAQYTSQNQTKYENIRIFNTLLLKAHICAEPKSLENLQHEIPTSNNSQHGTRITKLTPFFYI